MSIEKIASSESLSTYAASKLAYFVVFNNGHVSRQTLLGMKGLKQKWTRTVCLMASKILDSAEVLWTSKTLKAGCRRIAWYFGLRSILGRAPGWPHPGAGRAL